MSQAPMGPGPTMLASTVFWVALAGTFLVLGVSSMRDFFWVLEHHESISPHLGDPQRINWATAEAFRRFALLEFIGFSAAAAAAIWSALA